MTSAISVSDYIADYLRKIGVKCVFLVSGGGMMYLLDSISREKGINVISNHHEQASAMAAEAYARKTNSLGVCYATSGPGGPNAVTGMVGAWQDSAPVLFITGQSKVSQTIRGTNSLGLRQFGAFEVDIIPIVQSITKYAVFLSNPNTVRYHLEKAIGLALSGRPGPVLIDVPLDVQGAIIQPDNLIRCNETFESGRILDGDAAHAIVDKINSAKRPLILAGHGIRCAGAAILFRRLVKKLNIPVVTAQLAKDLMTYDDALFVGHPGVRGDRAGNFAIQNADLILSIGCSLHVTTTGYELDQFAPNAYKIQVDIDKAVLNRENVGVNQKVVSDVSGFLNKINEILPESRDFVKNNEWHRRCDYWKHHFAVINEPHKQEDNRINYYYFVDQLSDALDGDETIVADAGSAYYVIGQAFKTKGNQRVIISGALGSMGYALPASIGVSASDGKIKVICVTGDGSLQMNLQELQTVCHNNFNIKLFVVNNDGYLSIRNTQDAFFSGHYAGSSRDSGVSMPALDKIAAAYGIPYIPCRKNELMRSVINEVLQTQGPTICEVFALPKQEIIPGVSSIRLPDGTMQSKPLHDMYPFLSEEELLNNMYKCNFNKNDDEELRWAICQRN
jgi:acetolactate synthase I/II/III large subunit